jgi:uncharacterized protein (TIGR02453 family)
VLGPRTLAYLRDLGENNNRDWFQAHYDAYQEDLVEPARGLVVCIGEQLQAFAPNVHFEPRSRGSIMAINRDIRFSRDKRPYKDHLDLWFWVGDQRDGPGYFFRLRPEQLTLGAGRHHFEDDLLARYRAAVANSARGSRLALALEQIRAAGPYQVGGEHYKRVPAGFDPKHPRADLLRHIGLFVWTDMPIPPEASADGFAAFCATHYQHMQPLVDWLLPLMSA